MTKYLCHTKISKFWILVVLIIMAFPLLKVIHPILRSQSFMLLFLFFSPSDKVDIQCLGVNPKFYLTNAHVQNLGLRTSGAQIFIFNCFRFSLVFINFYLNMFFVFLHIFLQFRFCGWYLFSKVHILLWNLVASNNRNCSIIQVRGIKK